MEDLTVRQRKAIHAVFEDTLRCLQGTRLPSRTNPRCTSRRSKRSDDSFRRLVQEGKGSKAHPEVGLVHAAILPARRQVTLENGLGFRSWACTGARLRRTLGGKMTLENVTNLAQLRARG